MKRKMCRLLQPYMKDKGYYYNNKCFFRIQNNIAFCLQFDAPGSIYAVWSIIPLYIPSDFLYYTYGKRFACYDKSEMREVLRDEITREEWLREFCFMFENVAESYFEQLSSPEKILESVRPTLLGIKRFGFPTPYDDELLVYSRAFIGDELVYKKAKKYRKVLDKTKYLSSNVVQNLMDNLDEMLENFNDREVYFERISKETLKNCFGKAALYLYPPSECTELAEKKFSLYLEAVGSAFGGREVEPLIDQIIDNAILLNTKKARVAYVKSSIHELFHVSDDKLPVWFRLAEWPAGKNSPMKFVSEKRVRKNYMDRYYYEFIDVDTGETKTVEQ